MNTLRRAVLVAAIAVLTGLGFAGFAAVQVWAETPETVTIAWASDGVLESKTFETPNGLWLSANRHGTTTIFWTDEAGIIPSSFVFVADGGQWGVGLRGDMNGDGIVNVVDAIIVLQIIVGLR